MGNKIILFFIINNLFSLEMIINYNQSLKTKFSSAFGMGIRECYTAGHKKICV